MNKLFTKSLLPIGLLSVAGVYVMAFTSGFGGNKEYDTPSLMTKTITATGTITGTSTGTATNTNTLTNTSVGIEDAVSAESGIVVYPNPVVDVINYSLPEGVELSVARVLNINGQVVVKDLEAKAFNISELEAGNYFVQFIDSNNKVVNKKITKL